MIHGSFCFSPHTGGKAVRKILFPRFFHTEKKHKISFSTTFPRLKIIIRHTFPHSLGKLCGKRFTPCEALRTVSIDKFLKNFMYFFINFIKTLVIFRNFSYNHIRSGGLWCIVVSFPQFPQSFPQFRVKKQKFSTLRRCS